MTTARNTCYKASSVIPYDRRTLMEYMERAEELMTYGITQCYLPPDTSEHIPL